MYHNFLIHSFADGYLGCIEIKNIVTIAKGEWEGIVGRGVYRSYYKGHKDKIKREGRGGGGRWDWLGWGGGKRRKCRQL